MMRLTGLGLVIASLAGTAWGALATVPEIDGATAPAVIGLIAGAYLILRARKSRQK